ncbi:MAG: NUDIX domain-containing protein [Minisyncoccia bacterium]
MAKQSVPQLRFAAIATDVALFTIKDAHLYVRLVAVDRPPYYKNSKGLPGGLIDPKETAEETATRHIKQKAYIDTHKIYSEQLYTFSTIDRDPRGRVIAVAYLALVPWEKLSDKERPDSEEAWWCKVSDIGTLAYDHNEVLKTALKRLQSRITYTTVISKLLPDEFTLTELEKAYAVILKTGLDKRNFRKKILKLNVLKELPRKRSGGRFRPAQLYRFTSPKVSEIEVL